MFRTLTHSLDCFQDGRSYKILTLELGFITSPLKSLLSRPDKDLLRRLAVLDTRYTRYRNGTNVVQGREFRIETDFFNLVSYHSITAIANQLSRRALSGFHQISVNGVFKNDQHLRHLGALWDQLCHNTEELAAMGDLNIKLIELAKVFKNISPCNNRVGQLLGALSPAELLLFICCSYWNVLGKYPD